MDALKEVPQIAKGQLADAFTVFIGAANRLEDSHRRLHREVAELRGQLEERNRALASSVAETERMRAALREILDTLPSGVAAFDTHSEEIVLLNPEACRLLNIVEQAGWKQIPEWLRNAVKAVAGNSCEPGHVQEVLVAHGERKIWLAIRYSRMASLAREARRPDSSCLVVIFTDITAHKAAEQERERSRNAIALAEMATMLAHEIRNPLGSLELLTGCLAGDPGLSDESKRCLQHLRAGVRSLSATVNNVLCFHCPGTQQLSPVELGSFLKGSVEFIRPLAQQRGVSLSLCSNLKDEEIAGDPNGLRQLILNLASNALRHTEPGGAVTISAAVEVRRCGRVAVIQLSDTGSGIRPEDLPHIFKVGFTTTGQTPGLGLAVCQRIITQHHGMIDVRSQLGQGTTFQMEFPVL